ncbi:hypothetical protein HK101_010209 [Irineochytrium annulatum]|nr:hypothetical protein HK101_010209 [Irineochytrium annulatum]
MYSAVAFVLTVAAAVNGQVTDAPSATLAPTTSVFGATTTTATDLILGGIDVTQIFETLTPCTQDCLAQNGVNVTGLTLPVLSRACQNSQQLVSNLGGCMQQNNCNATTDQTLLKTLPQDCSMLNALIPGATTTATGGKAGATSAIGPGVSTIMSSATKVAGVQVMLGVVSAALVFAML